MPMLLLLGLIGHVEVLYWGLRIKMSRDGCDVHGPQENVLGKPAP